jgi:peptidoglycan/LPS O-acetylase OafA/YrhL
VNPPVHPAEPQHFAFLDALRGLAALAVVVVHTVQNFSGGSLTPLLGLGAAGVQLFYVVSAYSLCLSFAQRQRSEARPLRNYLLRRFFRIAPLFWLAIGLYLLRPYLLPDFAAPVDVHPPSWTLQPWHVLATALFVNGWHYESINFLVPGGWSVAVESNFYLLVPFLFAFASSLRRAVVLVGLTLCMAVVCRFVLYRMVGADVLARAGEAFGIFAGLWLPAQLPVFALGILMFWLVPRHSLQACATNNRLRLLQPLVLCGAALALLWLAPPAWSSYLPQSFQAGLLLLGCSWLIAWWTPYLVVNPVTQFLGKVSYSLYLLHFLALHLVLWASRSLYEPAVGAVPVFWQAFPCVLLLACVLAWLGYRLVEVPGQALGRRLIARS